MEHNNHMFSKINFESEAKTAIFGNEFTAIFGNECAIQYFFFFNNCILAIATAMCRLRIFAAAVAAAIFFYIRILILVIHFY